MISSGRYLYVCLIVQCGYLLRCWVLYELLVPVGIQMARLRFLLGVVRTYLILELRCADLSKGIFSLIIGRIRVVLSGLPIFQGFVMYCRKVNCDWNSSCSAIDRNERSLVFFHGSPWLRISLGLGMDSVNHNRLFYSLSNSRIFGYAYSFAWDVAHVNMG